MDGHADRPPTAADRGPMRAAAAAPVGSTIDRGTLRFADQQFESEFRVRLYRTVIGSVRAAHVLGITLLAVWGLLITQVLIVAPELDLFVRFGLMILILALGLIITLLPAAARVWEVELIIVNLMATLLWALTVTATPSVPFDLGYVGVIFIMAFAFTLNRLRFVLMAGLGIAMILVYLGTIAIDGHATVPEIMRAFFSLVSFYVLGMIAAYTLERSTRLLFLRERQLDQERRRSESLLLNVLPRAIADRLKVRTVTSGDRPVDEAVVADEHVDVAVLIADLVGFTEQAGRTRPGALVTTLNDPFSELDALSDRYGLETIKTIGDAHMAAAGVPDPVDDPTDRAMAMALDLVRVVGAYRWPSGDQVGVRVGIGVGPVMAGVVGRRRFAYDVWGDTVNLSSRLQAAAQPGSILVSEAAFERSSGRFVFGPPEFMDLKGKGRQALRLLVGRARTVDRPSNR